MKVKEYLESLNQNDDVTFIIEFQAKVTDNYCQTLYRETPIRRVWEWLKSDVVDFKVICTKVRPLSNVWENAYDNGHLKVVKITEEYDYIYNPVRPAPKHTIIYGK